MVSLLSIRQRCASAWACAAWAGALGMALLLLLGCSSDTKVLAPQEKFGSVSTYSRLFDATPAQTCEAARRALLSQGYVINTANADLVTGQKNFQPEADVHVQVMIRIVCVPDSVDASVSLGFVTALQDSYTLKKSNNSASLGVGGVGSVSLPFMTGGGESLVKVGSQTIAENNFYDNFFDLVRSYLLSSDLPPTQDKSN